MPNSENHPPHSPDPGHGSESFAFHEDELFNAGHYAPTVNALATIMLAICIFAILVYYLLEGRLIFTANLLLVPIMIAVLALVRHGHAFAGTRILLWGLLTAALASSYWVSGLSTPVLLLLPVLTMSAFWLLSRREAMAMLVMTALCVSWQFYLQTHGWTPPIPARSPTYYFVTLVGILLAAMLLGNAVAKNIVSQYNKLKEMNQTLENNQILLLQEIADHKKAETQLNKSDERFRLFMDNSPTIAWMKDEKGRLVYVSKSFINHFGMQTEAWLGKTDHEIFPKEVADTFRQNDLMVLERHAPIAVVEETSDQNGEKTYWLSTKFPFADAQGNRFVAGIGLNITDQKKSENLIRESEERFRKLFELNPDPSFIISLEGKFLDVNESACTVLGYSRDELLNMGLSGIEHPELADHFPARHMALREQGYAVFETEHLHKNGTFIPVEVSNKVITIRGQEVILVVARDLSPRKREEELRHQALLENALVRSAEELQQSIGYEIHDNLGQILSGISLLCKALQQQLVADNNKYAQIADSIVQHSNNAIYECKRLSSGLAPMHLESGDFLSSLVSLAQRTESLFNVTVKVDIDTGLEITDTSKALHIYRIIQEATNNAIRHGNAKNIWVSLSSRSGYLTLSIKDDGETTEVQDEDAFRSPTGMGLKIMQYRSKQFGGEMTLRHLPEGGVEVLVTSA